MQYDLEQTQLWFKRVVSKVRLMKDSQETIGTVECPFCKNQVNIRVINGSYLAKCRTEDCFSSSENWKWK
jgi:hypothetical protein